MQMGCLCSDQRPASKQLGRLSAVSPPVVAAYIFYLDTRNYQTSPGAAPYSYMSVPLSAIGNQSFSIPNAPPDAAIGLNKTAQVAWYASIDQFGDTDPNAYLHAWTSPPWNIAGVLETLAKSAGGAVQAGVLVQSTTADQFTAHLNQLNPPAAASVPKPVVQSISPSTSPTVMSQSPAPVQVECTVPASFSMVQGSAASGSSCNVSAQSGGSNMLLWLLAGALAVALIV
jgi:hypothetical protein